MLQNVTDKNQPSVSTLNTVNNPAMDRPFCFTDEDLVPEIKTLTNSEVESLLNSMTKNKGVTRSDITEDSHFICESTQKRIYPTKTAAYIVRHRLNSIFCHVHDLPYLCSHCKQYHLGTIKQHTRFNKDKGIWDPTDRRSRIPINREPKRQEEKARGRGFYVRTKYSNIRHQIKLDISNVLSLFEAEELLVQNYRFSMGTMSKKENPRKARESREKRAQENASRYAGMIDMLESLGVPETYCDILERSQIQEVLTLPQKPLMDRIAHLTELLMGNYNAEDSAHPRSLASKGLIELELLVMRSTPHLWEAPDKLHKNLLKAVVSHKKLEAASRPNQPVVDQVAFEAQWRQDNAYWLNPGELPRRLQGKHAPRPKSQEVIDTERAIFFATGLGMSVKNITAEHA